MLSVYPSFGRDRNHELAALRRPVAPQRALQWAFLLRSGTI
jgi:hypothetical protein